MSVIVIVLLSILSCTCNGIQPPVALQKVADIPSIITTGAYPNDGTGRLFLADRMGKVLLFKDGVISTFLDFSERVYPSLDGGHRGFLGLAFHPAYSTNGRFYVWYSGYPTTNTSDHRTVISEFLVSPTNADEANPGSEKIVFQIDAKTDRHVGGFLGFGPNGLLHFGLGDGNPGNAMNNYDPDNVSQNVKSPKGAINRINVNKYCYNMKYCVPADNPYKNTVFAKGTRQPFTCTFDKGFTGRLYCTEVGEDNFEEINQITLGKNYGWPILEGQQCLNCSNCFLPINYMNPVVIYSHQPVSDVWGNSIAGLVVYRGQSLGASYFGKFLFGDLGSSMGEGRLFQATSAQPFWKTSLLPLSNPVELQGKLVISLFEDSTREVYVSLLNTATYSGELYKLVLA